jgi:hypothetical protein
LLYGLRLLLIAGSDKLYAVSALLPVVLMILVAGLPMTVTWWYFRAKYAVASRVFLAAMLAGLVTVVLAAVVQILVEPFAPQINSSADAKWIILYTIFVEIAATEELTRFLILLLFERLLKKSMKKMRHNRTALLRMFGMVSGFSFAAIETIFFTTTNIAIDAGLVRAISAAPLHGACGIRAGNAVLNGKHSIGFSMLSVLFAIALHGIYNFLVQRGGFFPYLGVALAVTALISGAQSIRFDAEDEDSVARLDAPS